LIGDGKTGPKLGFPKKNLVGFWYLPQSPGVSNLFTSVHCLLQGSYKVEEKNSPSSPQPPT